MKLSNRWIVALEAALAVVMALDWLHPLHPLLKLSDLTTITSVFLPTMFGVKYLLDELAEIRRG